MRIFRQRPDDFKYQILNGTFHRQSLDEAALEIKVQCTDTLRKLEIEVLRVARNGKNLETADCPFPSKFLHLMRESN